MKQLPDANLWYAEVYDATTTIWAQFEEVNPNDANVEINVRQMVFYPEKEGNFFGLGSYDPNKFPIRAEGNVYVDKATAFKTEINGFENPNFKTDVKILEKPDGVRHAT